LATFSGYWKKNNPSADKVSVFQIASLEKQMCLKAGDTFENI